MCHQSVSLAARYLERHGIATVVMGCARDVVEHCGVPRFVFSDFPLGNPAGRPFDQDSQRLTLALALDLLESARAPQTTVQSPLVWSGDPGWKADFCDVSRIPASKLAARRAAFEEQKERARGAGRRENPAGGGGSDNGAGGGA